MGGHAKQAEELTAFKNRLWNKLKENGVKTVRFNKYPTKDVDTYPVFIYTNGNEKSDNDYNITIRGKS